MLLAVLVAYPAAAGDRLVALVTIVGSTGWLLLALGLVGRWPLVLVWGLAAFGAEYALFLRLRGGSVDARAPYVAAALLLVTELAFLSIGRGQGSAERGLVARTVVATTAAVGGAALVGGLLLVASGSASAGLAVEGAGVAAAVLAVAFLVRVAARPRS